MKSLSSLFVLAALAVGCGDSPLALDAAVPMSEAGPVLAADAGADDIAPIPGPDTAAPAADVPLTAGADAADAPAVSPGPDTGGAPPRLDAPPAVTRDLDILFVVDNSPSMEEEQDNLRRNFPVFMNQLRQLPGGLPNLHVAVVSTDLGAGRGIGTGACARPGGDRGIFQTKPACGLANDARFISSANGGTQNNFAGDIAQVFSCMADLGVRGCGYEHHLQAARVALYEAITPENSGFLRRDAFLAIIIISDEDDCSGETTSDLYLDDLAYPGTTASFRCSHTGHVCNGAAPPLAEFDVPLESCQANPAGRLIKVDEIVESIRALKARPDQQILVSGIFGWPREGQVGRYSYVRRREGLDVNAVCESFNNGESFPGLRLKKFVESFGAASSFHSICDNDFSPTLTKIGEKLAGRL